MLVLTDGRHIVGASWRASRPIRLSLSGEVSPFVAASRILDGTWALVPDSKREMSSQTSSRTARRSAVVAGSSIGDPQKEKQSYRNRRGAEFNIVKAAQNPA